MFSSDSLNSLVREVLAQFSGQGGRQTGGAGNSPGNAGGNGSSTTLGAAAPFGLAVAPGRLTPSQALVIAGLLGGVLEVTSILVDKNQVVEILLSGSLKQKTPLDKMLDQIGSVPFDEVVRAIVRRLGV